MYIYIYIYRYIYIYISRPVLGRDRLTRLPCLQALPDVLAVGTEAVHRRNTLVVLSRPVLGLL